jgi:hypothetical protein
MPEAGWYEHPDSETQLRWWDGADWTNQYAPKADEPDAAPAYGPDTAPAYGPATVYADADDSPAAPDAIVPDAIVADAIAPDALAPTQPEVPASNVDAYAARPAATVNPGLPWGTVSVWVLAFSPWLTMASVIAAFWSAVADGETSYYWVPILLVPHALTVGLAVLDARRLREWQHPRVPHWAWSVLGAPAYLIARSVALRGTTIRGSVPLWVALGNIVLTWLAITVGLFALGALIVWVIQQLSDSMSGAN